MVRVRDSAGTLRTIKGVRARDASGVLRVIQRIRMRDSSGVLRVVFQYLNLAVDKSTAYGSGSGAVSNGTVTSETVTATVSGGTAPYTYLWTRIDGSLAISATASTAAATAFTGNVSDTDTADFVCTVTDATGAKADSITVMAQLNWFDTR